MKTIHRRVCPTYGTELKMRVPNDGSDTTLAYCLLCGRYYGRVMNSSKRQFSGFRPAGVGNERE